MKRSWPGCVIATIACLLAAASAARGDFVPWTYRWDPIPRIVYSDIQFVPLKGTAPRAGVVRSKPGEVIFSGGPALSLVNSTGMTAVALQTKSWAADSLPDRFTNAQYTLRLWLRDDRSHKAGYLYFSGELNGTLSNHSAGIKNKFLGKTVQHLVLGATEYTVGIGPFAAPGPPGSVNAGAIAAHIDVRSLAVRGAPGVAQPFLAVSPAAPPAAPEPSALVLAVLGLSFVGFARWRRRGAA